MQIEIWSDVVCPWCFIGKRRLEKALAGFDHPVDVVYRSYQLDPSAPVVPTETVAESLGRKYGGGPDAGRKMVEQVEAVAAEEGLLFRLGEAQRANTVDAHRLLHLALAEGGAAQQRALKEELLAAYFLRVENPADHEVLTAAAISVGLDESRVRAVLAGDEFREAVFADIDRANDLGATGVPFFVIDQKYGIPGAQPVEVFTQVLERAWSESHPTLQVVGGDGETCGPDGCAV
ncbi:MAG: DsbA family oxidoreductase [Nocardioidaceae bacterium]|nr:DsbA family oxidoreductase [Nocardioidaceae bacterium]